MKDTFLRVNDVLYNFCIWVSGLAIFAMALIIPWGIFTRYVLGTGSQWPEPVAILLMVLFTFIGAAASYRAGGHIAVNMITDQLPPAAQGVLRGVVHVLMLLVSLFMVIYGGSLVAETWGQSISEIPWMPVGLTYSPVPIGGAFTTLFVIEHILYGSQHARPIVTYDQEH